MSPLGNRFMLTEYREHGTREVILDLFLSSSGEPQSAVSPSLSFKSMTRYGSPSVKR
jgi:hypothetical protein